MPEPAEDMALVAELIRKILDRLDALDGVEKAASRDEVQALARSLAAMKPALSEDRVRAIPEQARLGAREGAEALLDRLESMLAGNRNTALQSGADLARAVEELERRTDRKIARAGWIWLSLTAFIGLLCGALLAFLFLDQPDAARFGWIIRTASESRAASYCEGEGGYMASQDGKGTACVIWRERTDRTEEQE